MQVAIIGYGAVGPETAKILGERGDEVVIGQRRPPKDLAVGARFIATDVLDRESLKRACAGRAVVRLRQSKADFLQESDDGAVAKAMGLRSLRHGRGGSSGRSPCMKCR